MKKLLKLFEELNDYILLYDKAYRSFRKTTLKKSEDIESKRNSAIDQMQNVLTLIEDVIKKIEECYSNELRYFYKTFSKEKAEEVNDVYIEIINRIESIRFTLSLQTLQRYEDVMNLNKRLVQRFDIMENNIKVYNNNIQNFGFKIISPEEAHKRYGEMMKLINEDFKNRERLNEEVFIN